MPKKKVTSRKTPFRSEAAVFNVATGRRLLIFRAAFNLSGEAAADAAGFALKREGEGKAVWAQLENGSRQLVPERAVRLMLQFGVTPTWIYMGYSAGMSGEVLKKLQEGERLVAEAAARGERWRLPNRGWAKLRGAQQKKQRRA
jgi:transcriptional regulator with XRE-family HTH domain